MEESGRVLSEIKDGVGIISFYHTKSNSLPKYLLKDLTEEIEKFSRDKKVNIIQLQTEGTKVFCAGAYFDELLEIKNLEQGKEFFLGFANLLNTMRKCPKFIITKVIGKAIGGGVGIIAASDYVIASENASLKLSELSLGIGAFVIGPMIEHKVGKHAFLNMSINTGWYTSGWAHQIGLYSELYKTKEEVDKVVEDHTLRLSEYSPESMLKFKEVYWKTSFDWDSLLDERAAISGELVLSSHTKKFIKSFKRGNK